MDLDAPISRQDVDELSGSSDAAASGVKATPGNEEFEGAQVTGGVDTAEDQPEIPQTAEDVAMIEEQLTKESLGAANSIASALEIVADTTFDGSSREGMSDLAPVKSEVIPSLQDTIIDPVSEEIRPVASSSPAEALTLQTGSTQENEIQGEASPTTQSMKAKIRSLISDFATAVLSREEVNAFEDLLMDAKEMLYGARRRGRDRES